MPQNGNFSRLAEMYSLENRSLFNTICPCQVFNPSVSRYRSTPLQNWGETLSRPRATAAWPESFGSLDVAHCANVHTIGGKWAYSWEFYLFLPQAPTTRHIKLICFKCTASSFPPRIFCSLNSFVPSTCTANVIFRGQLGIYISAYICIYLQGLPQTEFMPINVGHIPLVKWSPRLQTLPTFSQSVGQSCTSSGFMAKSV